MKMNFGFESENSNWLSLAYAGLNGIGIASEKPALPFSYGKIPLNPKHYESIPLLRSSELRRIGDEDLVHAVRREFESLLDETGHFSDGNSLVQCWQDILGLKYGYIEVKLNRAIFSYCEGSVYDPEVYRSANNVAVNMCSNRENIFVFFAAWLGEDFTYAKGPFWFNTFKVMDGIEVDIEEESAITYEKLTKYDGHKAMEMVEISQSRLSPAVYLDQILGIVSFVKCRIDPINAFDIHKFLN